MKRKKVVSLYRDGLFGFNKKPWPPTGRQGFDSSGATLGERSLLNGNFTLLFDL
jgi:hypothetical protein